MRSLKIPAGINERHWNLSERERFFLDLTIMTDQLPSELYQMVFVSGETQVQRSRKATAILNSTDGREYTELRSKQLVKWYGGDEAQEDKGGKAKPKTIEEAFADLAPTFIKELYTIMENRNDAAFADTMKLFLAKSLKDIQTDKMSDPPRRYLPEICYNCRYKAFCESQCDDECEVCRYKKYANENGVVYDHKNQLEIDEKK